VLILILVDGSEIDGLLLSIDRNLVVDIAGGKEAEGV